MPPPKSTMRKRPTGQGEALKYSQTFGDRRATGEVICSTMDGRLQFAARHLSHRFALALPTATTIAGALIGTREI